MKIRIGALVALALFLCALAWLYLAVHFLNLGMVLYSIASPEVPEEMVAWWDATQYYVYSVGAFVATCVLSFFVAFPRFRNKRSLAKVVLLVSGSFLNLFFLWTAHVLLGDIGVSLSLIVFVVLSHVTSLGIADPQDYLCLGLLLTTLVSAFLSAVPGGIKLAVARATQAGSLVLIPLGLEVYIFDKSEYNLHFTMAQQALGLAWFTNADLLYLSTFVFVATTALVFLSGRLHEARMP